MQPPTAADSRLARPASAPVWSGR